MQLSQLQFLPSRFCPLYVNPGTYPDSKVHGATLGSTWVLSTPGGPRVGPLNRAIRVVQWNRLHPQATGVGVIKPISPFLNFPYFQDYQSIGYLYDITWIHIGQALPQLSCEDTCQVWKRFKLSKLHLNQIFRNGEINERSLNNPTPGKLAQCQSVMILVG